MNSILVDGCEPFSEDLWKEIKINKFTFHGVKLCSRCKVKWYPYHFIDNWYCFLSTLLGSIKNYVVHLQMILFWEYINLVVWLRKISPIKKWRLDLSKEFIKLQTSITQIYEFPHLRRITICSIFFRCPQLIRKPQSQAPSLSQL